MSPWWPSVIALHTDMLPSEGSRALNRLCTRQAWEWEPQVLMGVLANPAH